MLYHEHKKFFEVAYQNGTDTWTHLPIDSKGARLIENLKKGSMVLDVGSGRGLFAKQLAEAGYKVIGIDFEKSIVGKANKEIKNWKLEGKLRFVEADVLDIPFADTSFDAIYDFGLFENLYKEDWAKYAEEINRVLKPGGFYFNVSLSRETQRFFDFNPKNSENGDFEKYGMHYHFFEKEEIAKIFEGKLKIVSQENKHITNKPVDTILLESLFQK